MAALSIVQLCSRRHKECRTFGCGQVGQLQLVVVQVLGVF